MRDVHHVQQDIALLGFVADCIVHGIVRRVGHDYEPGIVQVAMLVVAGDVVNFAARRGCSDFAASLLGRGDDGYAGAALEEVPHLAQCLMAVAADYDAFATVQIKEYAVVTRHDDLGSQLGRGRVSLSKAGGASLANVYGSQTRYLDQELAGFGLVQFY